MFTYEMKTTIKRGGVIVKRDVEKITDKVYAVLTDEKIIEMYKENGVKEYRNGNTYTSISPDRTTVYIIAFKPLKRGKFEKKKKSKSIKNYS